VKQRTWVLMIIVALLMFGCAFTGRYSPYSRHGGYGDDPYYAYGYPYYGYGMNYAWVRGYPYYGYGRGGYHGWRNGWDGSRWSGSVPYMAGGYGGGFGLGFGGFWGFGGGHR